MPISLEDPRRESVDRVRITLRGVPGVSETGKPGADKQQSRTFTIYGGNLETVHNVLMRLVRKWIDASTDTDT